MALRNEEGRQQLGDRDIGTNIEEEKQGFGAGSQGKGLSCLVVQDKGEEEEGRKEGFFAGTKPPSSVEDLPS